jgi:tetratricopeptide (TPR) repeat protein
MDTITATSAGRPDHRASLRGQLWWRRLRRLAVPIVVAALLGVAAGRFVTYDGSSGESTAAPRTTASPAQRVRQLEAAVQARPDDLKSLQGLGAAYVQHVAVGGDVSEYNRAEEVLAHAETLSPDDSRTILRQGYLALARHDFARARELGNRAHTIDPYDAQALAVIVDGEIELGAYDGAATHLQEMLDLRPSLAAYSRVSYLRELHGDIPGAQEAFALAEAAGSGSRYDLATVAVLRGKLALNQGDLDDAAARFGDARSLAPSITGLDAGVARLAAARGDIHGAIQKLRPVVAKAPTAEAAILLGDLLRIRGRDVEAANADAVVRDLARSEREAGADVAMEMAYFEADRGNAAASLDFARSAYSRKPDNVFAAMSIAWALRASGDPAAALPYVDQALRLGTRDGLLRYRASAVLADAGRLDNARAELQTAYEITPSFTFGNGQEVRALAARLGVAVPSGAPSAATSGNATPPH